MLQVGSNYFLVTACRGVHACNLGTEIETAVAQAIVREGDGHPAGCGLSRDR